MRAALNNGFILPFSLVLATSVLILATLVLATGEFEMQRRGQALLRQRVRTTLQAEVNPLVNFLAEQVLASGCASAFQPARDSNSTSGKSLAISLLAEPVPLHSESLFSAEAGVGFRSPVSEAILMAEFVELSPPGQALRMKLAWAAEDIALLADSRPPPAFWPLPSWFLKPVGERISTDVFLQQQIGPEWDQLPWIPAAEPLPFSPGLSPALVPVPIWLGLRFGIFASGAIGSRERIIRIRYYLEGALWNPYNRPMAMHGGGGQSPVFQMAMANLPEIRIHNLSRGVSTGWIHLDAASNDATGAQGIHGWIRSKGVLEPGEVVAFLEPDPKSQPEGLARTVHPAFLVGPADHVQIQFRPAEDPLEIALLDTGETDPHKAITDGAGWFRVEGFALDFSMLDFPRADEGDHPFYLEAGSIAFRSGHARQQVVMDRSAAVAESEIDPRRLRLSGEFPIMDAAGRPVPPGADLQVEVRDLADSAPFQAKQLPPGAVFSWPAQQPPNPLAAADLPGWREAFRIGTAGATRLNQLLDVHANWQNASTPPVMVQSETGQQWTFGPAFPVNLLSPAVWEGLLAKSARENPATGMLTYSAHMSVDENRPEDFRSWSRPELEAAATSLVGQLAKNPSRSVADFYNRGELAKAFPGNPAGDHLHALMPLRGWLREAPPLRNHGSAWILHLLLVASEDDRLVRQSARVWLLETRSPEGTVAFTVQRFEWTNPLQHCLPAPR